MIGHAPVGGGSPSDRVLPCSLPSAKNPGFPAPQALCPAEMGWKFKDLSYA